MLDRDQAAIAATLLHGPDHLPDGLFAGDEAAVLRGLRVHATTIFHARLVALEESFPRTRELLGDAEFNRVSRLFVEDGGASGRSLTNIGYGFAERLTNRDAADLARAEWLWLQSYHAADAWTLQLIDLAGLDEASLLGLPVRGHPATHCLELNGKIAPLLDPALALDAGALLFVRPDADVRIVAVDVSVVALLADAKEISPLGNLIARLDEAHPDGGAAIAALIDAGAFEKV